MTVSIVSVVHCV